MNLSDARKFTRDATRNAGDTNWYNDEVLDRAISAAGNQFVNETSCLRAVDSLSLVEDAYTISTGFPTNFRADRVRQVYILNQKPLSVLSYQTLLGRYESGTSAGRPREIAFSDTSAGVWSAAVYPVADANYTIYLLWTPVFSTWTYGTPQLTATVSGGAVTAVTVNSGGYVASGSATLTLSGGGGTGATLTATVTNNSIASVSVGAGGSGYTSAPTILVNGVSAAAVEINVPDDIFIPVLRFGAPWYAQYNQPEQGYVQAAKQNFLEHIRRVKGTFGNRGQRVALKARLN